MSSWMHPAGPESEWTYWRRRGLALVIAVVALTLAFWLVRSLVSGGTNSATVAATPSNLPDSAVLDSPSSSPSGVSSVSGSPSASGGASSPAGTASAPSSANPSGSASAVVKPSATPKPTPTPAPECVVADLAPELIGKSHFKVGTSASWNLTFTHKGTQACVLDLGKHPVTVSVTSGAVGIWSSAHCPKQVPTAVLQFKPGATLSVPVTWNLKPSSSGCPVSKTNSQPGAYNLSVTIDQATDRRVVLIDW